MQSANQEDSSDDDYDDYMSEQFLKQMENNDVRPGLLSTSQRREHTIKKKQNDQRNNSYEKRVDKLSKGRQEADQLEAGCNKPIDSSNKGFQLFEKMLSQSMKDQDPQNQLKAQRLLAVEPIAPKLKNDDLGLGYDSERKERLELARSQLAQHAQQAMTKEELRMMLSKRKRTNQAVTDLFKGQKSCFELDSGQEVKEPEERWFWPRAARTPLIDPTASTSDEAEANDSVAPIEDPEEELEFEDTVEKLSLLSKYMRTKYFYCQWCGVRYKDQEDMDSNCPGDDRAAHDE